ncbi:glycosyltransferase [candidate division KSB1 bacterium]|nr:glycosyltransferase [candidate division KSB1 bacterium]
MNYSAFIMMNLIFWLILIIVFYSYLFYPLVLLMLAHLFPKSRKIDDNFMPFVSVIVAAYNEEDNIEAKVENFKKLDYPKSKIEMLFGSDGSSDNTNALLKSREKNNIRCFYYEQRNGKAAVLNKLVKEARGEILIFSDANTIYDHDAIKMLVRHFADDEVGGVCGQLNLVNPNENVGGKGELLYWKYENILKELEGRIKTVLGANGAIYALRNELYYPLPTNKVIMDDFLIPLKAVEFGKDVVYDRLASGSETTSSSIEGEFQRKIRIGAANFNALVEIKNLLSPLKGFVAFGLWSHKIFRWFSPFLLIAAFILNINLLTNFTYQVTMAIQLLFYSSAAVGYFFNRNNFTMKLFSYPLYFSAINLALAIGFIKFITGTQKPAWSRVERAQ